MNKHKPYEIEGLPLGEALIKVLSTEQKVYGLHKDTHWDAEPYWKSFPAIIIATEVRGYFHWGPFKQRKNSKREVEGESEISLLRTSIYTNLEYAQNLASHGLEMLKEKGFNAQIQYGRENESRQLGRKFRFESYIPPNWVIRRLLEENKPPYLSDLYLRRQLKGGEVR